MSDPCEELRRFHRSRERASAPQRARLPSQRRALRAKALAQPEPSSAGAESGSTKMEAELFASNHPESWRSASAGQFILCRAARQGVPCGEAVALQEICAAFDAVLICCDRFLTLEVGNGSIFPAPFHLRARGCSSPGSAFRRTAEHSSGHHGRRFRREKLQIPGGRI